jgi:hypothetical protein
MPPNEPGSQQDERQPTTETVHESSSKRTTPDDPQTKGRQSAHNSRSTTKTRPTSASMTRQSTQHTLHGHGLAGPPPYARNRKRDETHHEEDYEEANPCMREEQEDAGF